MSQKDELNETSAIVLERGFFSAETAPIEENEAIVLLFHIQEMRKAMKR